MINHSDLLQLCRLCLVDDEVTHSIFEETGDLKDVFLKITSCLPVSISRDDNLPKKICNSCSTKLDSFYKFWNDAATSEKQLQQWLKQLTLNNQEAQLRPEKNNSKKQVKEEAMDGQEETAQVQISSEAKTYILQQQQLPYAPPVVEENEEPVRKRPKRASAMKALEQLESDDDSGDNYAKIQSDDNSEKEDEENYQEGPSTSMDDQPGPSGVGKGPTEASCYYQENHPTFPNYNLNNDLYYLPQLKPSDHLDNTSTDQFNPTDTELLRMLSTEEECTAILENIAATSLITAPHFEQSLENQVASNNIQKSPATFKCEMCDKCYTTKKILRKHIMNHSKTKTFACSVCDKKFRHQYELKAHQKIHENPSFQCDICSSMFFQKSHLITHRRKHLGEFVCYCEDCGIGFVRKNLYNNHRRLYHNGEKFICDICGSSLTTSSGLKEHKRTHEETHGTDRCHVCEICGKSYLSNRNLNAHMKIHSKLKKYICNICGKSVSSKEVLETHIKMHTGLKDHVCPICNSVFASREYLKVHQRIHNANKPYNCQMCGKGFTQKTSLTVHIRTHTGQKPYKCECGKNFTTKSHLMAHYKTHDVGGVDIDYISNIERLK